MAIDRGVSLLGMDIEIIMGIIGVLGFILSLFVFILTRWERRSCAVIELFMGDHERFEPRFTGAEIEPGTAIGVRVINVGARPIVVNRSSFLISGNSRQISLHSTDWLGIDLVPAPLRPGESFEVGLWEDVFREALGEAEFRESMNSVDYEKCVISVTASFKDSRGKEYTSGVKYKYSFYVNEFWPAQHVGS